jgi:hypothetical protein
MARSQKTKFAAGGMLRKGKVPNPVTGIFVNPIKRKKNTWGVGISETDTLGPSMAAYMRHDPFGMGEAMKKKWDKAEKARKKRGPRARMDFPKDDTKKLISSLKKQIAKEERRETNKVKRGRKKRRKTRKRRKNITSAQARALAKGRKRTAKGRFANPAKRRKRRKARKTRKRRYTKRAGNPRRKVRRRRNQAMTGYMPKDVYKIGDSLKPIAAGALGFAAPGLLESLTRNYLTKKIAPRFKDRGGQKAQAIVSLGMFAGSIWATAKFGKPGSMITRYREPFLMGLGVRAFRDLLDGFLGTKKDSLSGNLRSIFGLTPGMAVPAIAAGTVNLEYVPGSKNLFHDAEGKQHTAVIKDGKFYIGSKMVTDGKGKTWTVAIVTKIDQDVATGAYYIDEPELGSSYWLDEPADMPMGDLSGERSYGDMGEDDRSYGDMGEWSENRMLPSSGSNPFKSPGF